MSNAKKRTLNALEELRKEREQKKLSAKETDTRTSGTGTSTSTSVNTSTSPKSRTLNALEELQEKNRKEREQKKTSVKNSTTSKKESTVGKTAVEKPASSGLFLNGTKKVGLTPAVSATIDKMRAQEAKKTVAKAVANVVRRNMNSPGYMTFYPQGNELIPAASSEPESDKSQQGESIFPRMVAGKMNTSDYLRQQLAEKEIKRASQRKYVESPAVTPYKPTSSELHLTGSDLPIYAWDSSGKVYASTHTGKLSLSGLDVLFNKTGNATSVRSRRLYSDATQSVYNEMKKVNAQTDTGGVVGYPNSRNDKLSALSRLYFANVAYDNLTYDNPKLLENPEDQPEYMDYKRASAAKTFYEGLASCAASDYMVHVNNGAEVVGERFGDAYGVDVRNAYYYLYSKYGKEKADDFFESCTDMDLYLMDVKSTVEGTNERANARLQYQKDIEKYGEQPVNPDGWDVVKDTVKSGFATFNKGLFSTLDFILPTEVLGDYDVISQANDYYSDEYDYYERRRQNSLAGRGGFAHAMSDLGVSTINAVPSTALAWASGGTSLGASGASTLAGASSAASTGIGVTLSQMGQQALRNPQTYMTLLQTLGPEYEKAKASGASEGEAIAYAFTSAGLGSLIETSGGVQTLPGKLEKGEGVWKAFVKSGFEEGAEEIHQGLVSGSAEKVIYNPDKEMFSTTNEDAIINPGAMTKEYAMGAGVGWILGTPGTVSKAISNQISHSRIADMGKKYADNVADVIESGLESAPGSEAHTIATQMQAKVDSGENVSDYDIGLAVLTIDKEIRNEVYEAEGVAEKETKAPYDAEKAPAEFLGAVDNQLVSFVEKVENNEEGVPLSYVFGKTTDRLNADIKKLTGIDTTEYRHSVGKNSIRHIINGHGKNGKTDRSMANNDDIGRIGYVLDNYDDIELLDDTSKEFRDKNQRPAPMVRMSKRVDGTFYVVEAVPDAKAKKLAVVTAYIEKPSQQTRDVQAPLWIVRNASADNGSMDSIPTNGENVNGNISGEVVSYENMTDEELQRQYFKEQVDALKIWS